MKAKYVYSEKNNSKNEHILAECSIINYIFYSNKYSNQFLMDTNEIMRSILNLYKSNFDDK